MTHIARPTNINREQIVAIARPMFIQRGIAATEMKDIADACGIARSSLYRYFDSKESIALEIAGEILRFFVATLENAIFSTQNGYNAVANALTIFVEAMKSNIHLIKFLDAFDSYFTDGYPQSPTAQTYQNQMRVPPGALGAALARGVADGSVTLTNKPGFEERFIINTLLAVAQRVLPRANILRDEQGYAEEFLDEQLCALLIRISARRN